MSESEGTIQFAYALQPDDGPSLAPGAFAELAAWRSILRQLNLLGQHPQRYAGLAYGNVSIRDTSSGSENPQFVITASQTSGEPDLLEHHLVRITHCNLARFWIDAKGSEPPSSESLTHAMVYAADPRLNCVLHVHSPVLWGHRNALKLPETPAEAGYGSPAMVQAVAALMNTFQSRPLVFATPGHEDGIFACGHNLRDCGGLLISYLARARAMVLQPPQ